MPEHANDNQPDLLQAAADAALRAFVGWLPEGRSNGHPNYPDAVLNDPLLILAHAGPGQGRPDIEAVVRADRRSALVFAMSRDAPATIRSIELLVPGKAVERHADLSLWIDPLIDSVWLIRPGASGGRQPNFKFVRDGLEAHWLYPPRDQRDRDLGHEQASLIVTRLLAAFLASGAD